jgi:phosphoglycolate phosphatase-like HAD superfamily hydrolase
MPKTVCLDFDGVMNTYTGWQGPDVLFEPRPGLREFLESLRQSGFEVVVLSTRNLNDLVKGVTDLKPPAVVYLDDRAVCFEGDFDAALRAVKEFRAYWETP